MKTVKLGVLVPYFTSGWNSPRAVIIQSLGFTYISLEIERWHRRWVRALVCFVFCHNIKSPLWTLQHTLPVMAVGRRASPVCSSCTASFWPSVLFSGETRTPGPFLLQECRLFWHHVPRIKGLGDRLTVEPPSPWPSPHTHTKCVAQSHCEELENGYLLTSPPHSCPVIPDLVKCPIQM